MQTPRSHWNCVTPVITYRSVLKRVPFTEPPQPQMLPFEASLAEAATSKKEPCGHLTFTVKLIP